jgi:hypothetical protein
MGSGEQTEPGRAEDVRGNAVTRGALVSGRVPSRACDTVANFDTPFSRDT